jgi:hypothetical protein
MNHLIAKTRGKKGGFYKLISNKEIFELPVDLSSSNDYDPAYKLEEDEWFSIESFSTQDFCIDFLSKKFVSADYNQLTVEDYGNIEYLCSYQTGTYFFQKISSTQLLRKKYLALSNAPSLVEDEPLIVIHNYADAIYDKEEDTLYFKSLSAISSIFKGIAILYREATQEETEIFLENDFISLGEDYAADNVKKANRKRIAMAMDTINNFSPRDKKSIFKYIKGYCKNLKFDEKASSFTIETEEDLKLLLYGIEQRYYTTILGGEKRLANSITTL